MDVGIFSKTGSTSSLLQLVFMLQILGQHVLSVRGLCKLSASHGLGEVLVGTVSCVYRLSLLPSPVSRERVM